MGKKKKYRGWESGEGQLLEELQMRKGMGKNVGGPFVETADNN